MKRNANGALNVVIIKRPHTFRYSESTVLLLFASPKRSSQEAPRGGESQTLLPALCAVSREGRDSTYQSFDSVGDEEKGDHGSWLVCVANEEVYIPGVLAKETAGFSARGQHVPPTGKFTDLECNTPRRRRRRRRRNILFLVSMCRCQGSVCTWLRQITEGNLALVSLCRDHELQCTLHIVFARGDQCLEVCAKV
jgi:hypothetical protein